MIKQNIIIIYKNVIYYKTNLIKFKQICKMSNMKEVSGMLNDEKKVVDLYIPRKCIYTSKILNSKDRASV